MIETFVQCFVCATAHHEGWTLEETNQVLKEEGKPLTWMLNN